MSSMPPNPPPKDIFANGVLGSIYFAAGRMDSALPFLERATRVCTLDQIFFQMRPWLDLGRLRAAKGDRPGACAAFASILSRWGHAKPRSVTAEKARAEAAKLGCQPL